MNEYLKNLNRIEFVVTLACTGKCKHCSEGEHISNGMHIDGAIATNAIHEICKNYNIQSLMTFGGEPLLYPEVVCNIHKTAKESGIPERSLITNGFFSKDKTRIQAVVRMLAESGVQKILLSVDAFHQETIPVEPVKYFAKCLKEADISVKVHPAWLVAPEAENPYNAKIKELLAKFTEIGIEISSGNVIFPSGNAKKYLDEYFDEGKEYINPYQENPKDIHAISFSPNGDVLNGNIYEDSIENILDAYRP